MKKIKLTQGKYALVDDEDFERVNQYKWFACFQKKRNIFNACRKFNQKNIYLHQYIMNTAGKGQSYSIDHIDHDPLNNQKYNLRVCNNSENVRNQKLSKHNTSGFKGVCFIKHKNKYLSSICFNNKQMNLGYFDSPIEAAKAYNQKALELFGEFAYLNKIEAKIKK